MPGVRVSDAPPRVSVISSRSRSGVSPRAAPGFLVFLIGAAVLVVIRLNQPLHREILQNPGRAADVILIQMSQQQQLQLPDAPFFQLLYQLLAVPLVRRIDQRSAAGRLDQDAVRFPRLKYGDGELSLR